jgi:hypothetical protein
VQNRQPDDDFGPKIAALLKIEQFHGLSSDMEFIRKLNQNLSALEQTQTSRSIHRIWFKGICNGLAAASFGIIIFISLQTLPLFLINASLSGTELIQTKIVGTTISQNVLWQKIVLDFQKLK